MHEHDLDRVYIDLFAEIEHDPLRAPQTHRPVCCVILVHVSMGSGLPGALGRRERTPCHCRLYMRRYLRAMYRYCHLFAFLARQSRRRRRLARRSLVAHGTWAASEGAARSGAVVSSSGSGPRRMHTSCGRKWRKWRKGRQRGQTLHQRPSGAEFGMHALCVEACTGGCLASRRVVLSVVHRPLHLRDIDTRQSNNTGIGPRCCVLGCKFTQVGWHSG